MGISIALTLGLVIAQRVAVRRTGSLAIGADGLHYLTDLLTNAGVIVGIVASVRFGFLLADPLIGLFVAAVLGWSAWHVFRVSYDQLMDHELPEADRARIKSVVMRHDQVLSLHDLRTRAAGVSTFIQFHIELDPEISLMRAHEVSDAVERDLLVAFPKAEIIIHQDPAGVETPAPLAAS
jgi:ferrous-iron efflux pump FieF